MRKIIIAGTAGLCVGLLLSSQIPDAPQTIEPISLAELKAIAPMPSRPAGEKAGTRNLNAN